MSLFVIIAAGNRKWLPAAFLFGGKGVCRFLKQEWTKRVDK